MYVSFASYVVRTTYGGDRSKFKYEPNAQSATERRFWRCRAVMPLRGLCESRGEELVLIMYLYPCLHLVPDRQEVGSSLLK